MADRRPIAAVTLTELESDPYDALARLRADRPVAWLPPMGGWLVTSRALVVEAMRDAGRFTVDDPRFSTAKVVGPSMLSLDGPEHERHRQPFLAPFKRSSLAAEMTPWLPAECRRRLRTLRPAGRADLRAEFAAPLAVSSISRILGLIDIDEDELLAWYRAIVDAVVRVADGESIPETGRTAMAELRAAVIRTAGAPTSLLHHLESQEVLTIDELVSNTAVTLFGAIETTEGAIANAFVHVLDDPATIEQLRNDPTMIESAVEESLRLEPAAAVIDRYAVADTSLGDQEIRAGDFVRLSLLAANRDPTEFADPDRFDPTRTNLARHVTFVQGPHACLGLHLARWEVGEAIRAAMAELPGLGLVGSATDAPNGLVFRKPGRVTARWKTAAAGEREDQEEV